MSTAWPTDRLEALRLTAGRCVCTLSKGDSLLILYQYLGRLLRCSRFCWRICRSFYASIALALRLYSSCVRAIFCSLSRSLVNLISSYLQFSISTELSNKTSLRFLIYCRRWRFYSASSLLTAVILLASACIWLCRLRLSFRIWLRPLWFYVF